MTVATKNFRTLSAALRFIEDNFVKEHSIYVFRGQSNPKWKIRSTLSYFTEVRTVEVNTIIESMHRSFYGRLAQIGQSPNFANNIRGKLEYARHRGVPSPLIDFTLSPYIALFFAFNGIHKDYSNKGKKVALYVLDVSGLGIAWSRLWPDNVSLEYDKFMWKRNNTFLQKTYPDRTLKFLQYPASWNKRMQRQLGVFVYDTLTGRRGEWETLEDFVAECEDASGSPVLHKLLIPGSEARNAFERLELMGITGTNLMDDYAGAVMDAQNTYNFNPRTTAHWDTMRQPEARPRRYRITQILSTD